MSKQVKKTQQKEKKMEIVANETVDNIDAEPKVEIKPMKKRPTLWCVKCQSGISGAKDPESYSAGDLCPLCMDRMRMNPAREQRSGILQTIEEVVAERDERAKHVLKERSRNTIRGIDGPDEAIRKAKLEMKRENDDLKQQLAELQKTVQSLAKK
jgi:hypothetical protein